MGEKYLFENSEGGLGSLLKGHGLVVGLLNTSKLIEKDE
jgi:hypothetical protein